MNRKYFFGRTSESNLVTVDLKLQAVAREGLSIANSRKTWCPDFGISHGFRTRSDQFNMFKKGRKLVSDPSEIDLIKDRNGIWVLPEGIISNTTKIGMWDIEDKDQIVTYFDGIRLLSPHQKKQAFDFYCYIDGKADYTEGNLSTVALCMLEAGNKLGIPVKSGMNFTTFKDGPHIELINQ